MLIRHIILMLCVNYLLLINIFHIRVSQGLSITYSVGNYL